MHKKQERRCVACRNSRQQHEMLRVARLNQQYELDNNYKLGGRGAYICKNKFCIELTIKKRLLNKAFKTNLDASIYEQLGEYEQNN